MIPPGGLVPKYDHVPLGSGLTDQLIYNIFDKGIDEHSSIAVAGGVPSDRGSFTVIVCVGLLTATGHKVPPISSTIFVIVNE